VGASAAPIAASLLPFAIYVASVCSEPARWDTAELQGVPYILGIAHATGFPLYVIAAYLFSHLVPIGTVAFRTGVFSAMCVAGAALASYLAAREFGANRVCAVIASWWFGVTAAVWQRASRAEVHDLALVLSAFAVLFAIRWTKRGNERDLLGAVACFSLAIATHPVAVWLLPGLIVATVLAPRRPQPATVAYAVLIFLTGLALYAYLPLRSEYVVSHGLDPSAHLSGVHGGIFWNFNDPRTFDGFVAEVTGSRFGAGSTLLSALAPGNVQDALAAWLFLAIVQYGVFGFLLALIGLVGMWTRDWRAVLILMLMGLAAIPFAQAWTPAEGDPDRYRLLSLWILAPMIACAAGFGESRNARMWSAAIVWITLLLTIQTFANNRYLFNNRVDLSGRDLIEHVDGIVPRHSIVLAPWIDATTLAYGAYIDDSLGDRTVVPSSPEEFASDFAQWPRDRRIFMIAGPGTSVPGLRLRKVAGLDISRAIYEVVR
jgi:hypothetical protein